MPLPSAELEELLPHAVDYLCAHGALVNQAPPHTGVAHVPFSLLPYRFPAAQLAQAEALAPLFNRLVDAVSRDAAWLHGTLAGVRASDAFTARLLALHAEEGARAAAAAAAGAACPLQHPLRLGLHRSDYMLTAPSPASGPPALRQVELNTVASSMAGHASAVGGMHAYLEQRHAPALPGARAYFARSSGAAPPPPSPACQRLAAGLAAGHRAYASGRASAAPGAPPPPPLVVLFVVQPAERNVHDQRALEHELWRAHGIAVRRLGLAELGRAACAATPATLTPHAAASAPPLLLAAPAAGAGACQEVSVVYYRAGYTPADYPSEAEWAARGAAEASRALKCPCLAYHLAGTKKVQQALALAGAVERFLPSAAEAAAVRSCFAGLWSLDPAEEDAGVRGAVARARQEPGGFVIKPQREGGGSNLFGAAIAAALGGGMAPQELAGHILMERLHPPVVEACMVRGGVAAVAGASCELGVYGVYLGAGGAAEPLVNECAGTLLRTKLATSDEGGVAAGFAVIDSVMAV